MRRILAEDAGGREALRILARRVSATLRVRDMGHAIDTRLFSQRAGTDRS